MNHKKRKSESKYYPSLVEHLQDGILLHFDIEETIKEEEGETTPYFTYIEFWFPKDSSRVQISAVVESYGYFLGDGYDIVELV